MKGHKMTQKIERLEAAELMLIAGGETQGGCIDPNPGGDFDIDKIIRDILNPPSPFDILR